MGRPSVFHSNICKRGCATCSLVLRTPRTIYRYECTKRRRFCHSMLDEKWHGPFVAHASAVPISAVVQQLDERHASLLYRCRWCSSRTRPGRVFREHRRVLHHPPGEHARESSPLRFSPTRSVAALFVGMMLQTSTFSSRGVVVHDTRNT